jgi:tetratricopeptide (TPR) repeat protein
MAVSIQCSCGAKLTAKDEWVGRRVRCPACNARHIVPSPVCDNRRQRELFAQLSDDEKRRALDLDDFYLQSVLDARKGKARVVAVGLDTRFVERLTEEDIKTAIDIMRLQKKAIAASEAGRHREAITNFEKIIAKAPFDCISMMSIGVQYAYLQDSCRAVEYLKRALKIDPHNSRIRENLQSVQQHFAM